MEPNDLNCPICFELLDSKNIHLTCCNHIFCKKCIHDLSIGKMYYNCPLCRNYCDETIKTLKNATTIELYEIYNDVINSKESRRLNVSVVLINIINYILNSDDKRLLIYLLNNSTDEEFEIVYNSIIVKGEKHFIKIKDPIIDFCTTLLYYKYH